MNFPLTFSTSHGLGKWSNNTEMRVGNTASTVPMAPLTNPALTSMLRLSMTRAPTASLTTASRPAVLLQSLLSFSSCFAAFSCHLVVVLVSSTTSTQDMTCFSVSKRLNISSFTLSHCFLVGNRQTGVFPIFFSSVNFSGTVPSKTLPFRTVMLSSERLPRRTQSRSEQYASSFFCLSLIVSSS